MNLFRLGRFRLHSGDVSKWKIDCDALAYEDIECIAYLLSERLDPFGAVIGVPTGGIRLAQEMKHYIDPDVQRLLICDDVLTTGSSMDRTRESYPEAAIGAVIFARHTCPDWVTPLFTMTP